MLKILDENKHNLCSDIISIIIISLVTRYNISARVPPAEKKRKKRQENKIQYIEYKLFYVHKVCSTKGRSASTIKVNQTKPLDKRDFLTNQGAMGFATVLITEWISIPSMQEMCTMFL